MRQILLLMMVLAGACAGPDESKPSSNATPNDDSNTSNGESNNAANNQSNNAATNTTSCTTSDCICEPDVCSDGDACTRDTAEFDGASCQTLCSFAPIDACVSGDGCCPDGCTAGEDDDCACTPTTCEELGRVCGSAPDGCGAELACGECDFDETCSAGGACDLLTAPTCSGIADCPVGYNHCSMGACLECLTPPDCADGDVCEDNRCSPSPDCTANPAACPQLYTCTDGLCVPDADQVCDPMDPMSCPNGAFCDPTTRVCSGGNGMGCGLCNPDCTCPDAAFTCNGQFCAASDPTACLQCSGDQATCAALGQMSGEYICLPN